MFYYTYNQKFLVSFNSYDLIIADEKQVSSADTIFFLGELSNIGKDKFSIQTIEDCYKTMDLLSDLKKTNEKSQNLPIWLTDKIKNKKVSFINTNNPHFLDFIKESLPKSWRINIVALGDVGRTLAIGLRLLGSNSIKNIGAFDFDKTKVDRLLYEGNQVFSNFDDRIYPPIIPVEQDDLFNCDMFVFCASKFIPPIEVINADVRMVQFEKNSEIIKSYAKMAREKSFKGTFAVVSDPVDLLCKKAYLESNTDENGISDQNGLAAHQIHGYGLGVMNARANFYSQRNFNISNFDTEGRAFGPHGKGLIIANSITNYDHDLSCQLTDLTQNANLEIRKLGFKPYIAPALSSGALSIINTINQQWHYSAIFFDGSFIGTKNRLLETGLEWETYNFPTILYSRLEETHKYLGGII